MTNGLGRYFDLEELQFLDGRQQDGSKSQTVLGYKCGAEGLTHGEPSVPVSWREQGRPEVWSCLLPLTVPRGDKRSWKEQVAAVGRKQAGRSLGLREERKGLWGAG